MEVAQWTALAQGEVGIREKTPAPTVAEFLKKQFLISAEAHFVDNPDTRNYYTYATTNSWLPTLVKGGSTKSLPNTHRLMRQRMRNGRL